MLLTSWLRRLSLRRRRRPQAGLHTANCSPTLGVSRLLARQVEPLENRALLAVAVWDGGGSNNQWTTAENWVGDATPNPNDDLVFPEGAAHQESVNDFAPGTDFGTLLIASTGYVLSGNSVDLTSGVQATGGDATVNLPLRLLDDQGITANSGTLTLGSSIDLNGHQLALNASGEIQVQQSITGAGSLLKSGSGTAVLNVANSYSGTTTISAGILSIKDASGLGAGDSTASTATTITGGSLRLDGSFTVAGELLTLNSSTALSVNGDVTWLDGVTGIGSGNYHDLNITAGGVLQTTILGGDYWRVTSGGTLRLTGNSSLSQYLLVSASTLQVDGTLAQSVFLDGGVLAAQARCPER